PRGFVSPALGLWGRRAGGRAPRWRVRTRLPWGQGPGPRMERSYAGRNPWTAPRSRVPAGGQGLVAPAAGGPPAGRGRGDAGRVGPAHGRLLFLGAGVGCGPACDGVRGRGQRGAHPTLGPAPLGSGADGVFSAPC